MTKKQEKQIKIDRLYRHHRSKYARDSWENEGDNNPIDDQDSLDYNYYHDDYQENWR